MLVPLTEMPGKIPIYDFPIFLEETQDEKQIGHLRSGNTSVLLQAQGKAQAGGLAGGHSNSCPSSLCGAPVR